MWAEILSNRASLLTTLPYPYLKYASAVKTGCRIITPLNMITFTILLQSNVLYNANIYTKHKAHAFFSSCGNNSSILMFKPSLDLLQIIARSISGPGRKDILFMTKNSRRISNNVKLTYREHGHANKHAVIIFL